METVKITIQKENSKVIIDSFHVYDKNTLTEEQVKDPNFDPHAYDFDETIELIKLALQSWRRVSKEEKIKEFMKCVNNNTKKELKQRIEELLHDLPEGEVGKMVEDIKNGW